MKTKATTKVAATTAPYHQLYSDGPAITDPFRCWVIGDTPIITHAWSLKARLEMLDKQEKKTKPGREARDPTQDYRDSLYIWGHEGPRDPDDPHVGAIYGFPATGLKNSILAVAHKDKGVARTEVMSALFIHGKMAKGVPAKAGAVCDLPLVRLWAPPPQMREDMVRVGVGLNKTASLAYRGMFWPWAVCITGSLNTKVLPLSSLTFLIREAGVASGVCEWRNERKGMFGAYHLASREETQAWDDYARGGPMPEPEEIDPILLAAE
jgi:hypothetical protein